MSDERQNPLTRTPARQEGERPPCHGIAELVCPRDEEGVIQPQPECVSCADVKTCLRKAVLAEGLLKADPDPPSPVSKMSGFLKRWSRQKLARKESTPPSKS